MATEFQSRVYDKTREIPRGFVTTYKEIARAIGNPKAYRAVGNALNNNPHPIDVPCHRVVRSDLYVGGYSGGLLEKELLLSQEGVLIENRKILSRVFIFRR